jgi:hypothetical protein
MSTEVGGKISMFSGAVQGENEALQPFDGEKAVITWKWRFSTWQPNHFSKVIITMNKQVRDSAWPGVEYMKGTVWRCL